MPKIRFTLDKEMLIRINNVKEKEKIKNWSKTVLLLVELGLNTYDNKNFEKFSFTLHNVDRQVKEIRDMQIMFIGRVEKALKKLS